MFQRSLHESNIEIIRTNKRNKITDEQNNESYVPGFYLTFEEFKELLSIEEIPTISGFNSFENKIKELENSPKINNILILLINNFQILDAIDFEYTFLMPIVLYL